MFPIECPRPDCKSHDVERKQRQQVMIAHIVAPGEKTPIYTQYDCNKCGRSFSVQVN